MAKKCKKGRCAHCRRWFDRCRYNGAKQIYCTNSDCKKARLRIYQTERYTQRYADDPDYQKFERERCGSSLKRRREKARAEDDEKIAPVVHKPRSVDKDAVLRGLLAHLLGSDDSAEITDAMLRCEKRGQQVDDISPLCRRSTKKQEI